MKKVIRLNENDIEKLVKKIIKEQDDNSNGQLGMEFPNDMEDDGDDDDQAGYNIGHNTAEELMDLLNNEGDKDESIVWAFVNGFMKNVDPSVANLVIDSFTNGGSENFQESYSLNKIISKKRKSPRRK